MTEIEQIDKALDHLGMARANLLALKCLLIEPGDKPTAERLEAIWNKLGSFITAKRYCALRAFAENRLGYRYYDPGQKHPVDLCGYIRDKLRDLNEERIAELEAILE